MDECGNWNYDDAEEVPSPPVEEEACELKTICLRDFARLKLPPRKTVLAPILPERGLAMLFAGRGIGKTHVALGMAFAVSTGSGFLRWRADKPRNVLYVDGEMPQQALQERLLANMSGGGRRPKEGAFRLLCMDRQPLGMSINLAEAKHQKMIDSHLDEVDFLVLDNLSTLVNGGIENDAESWISMQAWLLQLRRRGVTVLIVHHAGRGGNARGTSKREDVLDTVIQLRQPDDYDPDEGARFEVHLTKARGVFGDDASAFEATLEIGDEGGAHWTCTDLKTADEESVRKVMELKDAGKTVREIADELEKSKSAVGRLLKKGERLRKAEAAKAEAK